jgi:hypothetical protein
MSLYSRFGDSIRSILFFSAHFSFASASQLKSRRAGISLTFRTRVTHITHVTGITDVTR